MCVFFFKQKTAYEMRISDWSSDVCSSDLAGGHQRQIVIAVHHIDALEDRAPGPPRMAPGMARFDAGNGCGVDLGVGHAAPLTIWVSKEQRRAPALDAGLRGRPSRPGAFSTICACPGREKTLRLLPMRKIGRAACRGKGCQ